MIEVVASTRRGRAMSPTLLVSGGFLVVTAAFWLWIQPTPDQLLERGLAETQRAPALAERLLRRAANADSATGASARIALCRLLVRRKAKDEVASLITSVNLQACRTDLLLAFGRDALRSGQRSEGLVALEAAGNCSGRDGIIALELLTDHYREWGQRKKQLQTAVTLVEMEPENPQRWADVLEIQTGMALESDCLATIQRALQRDLPTAFHTHLQSALVQQLVNRGEAKSARRELETLRSLEGESVRVRGFEVYVCRLEGDLKKSLQIVSVIVDDSPGVPFPRFTRGVILLDLRRFAEAADDLEKTVAAQPSNAHAYFKLSEAYRGLGQVGMAEKHRRIASEITAKQIQVTSLLKKREADPLDPDVYHELEQVHRELGEVDAANVWHRWAIRVTQAN